MTTITNGAGVTIDFEEAFAAMDSDVLAIVYAQPLADHEKQAFFRRYCAAHLAENEETFVGDTANPVFE